MNDPNWMEVTSLALILLGVLFDLSGCIGLVRLPDVYNRVQAATKCVVLGTTLILVGSAVWLATPQAAAKVVLCALFIVITSATAAHALGRAAHLSGIQLWKRSVVDRYAEDRRAAEREEGTA
jgi:multicomponent Na+:H+ antiporter subunit G